MAPLPPAALPASAAATASPRRGSPPAEADRSSAPPAGGEPPSSASSTLDCAVGGVAGASCADGEELASHLRPAPPHCSTDSPAAGPVDAPEAAAAAAGNDADVDASTPARQPRSPSADAQPKPADSGGELAGGADAGGDIRLTFGDSTEASPLSSEHGSGGSSAGEDGPHASPAASDDGSDGPGGSGCPPQPLPAAVATDGVCGACVTLPGAPAATADLLA